jgi:arginine N-succinyltransferase
MAEPLQRALDRPVVRTGTIDDAQSLLELAREGGDGLTNLPADLTLLKKRLEESEAALRSHEAREQGAAIVLLAEVEGDVVASSMVFPQIGLATPFYSYRLLRQTFVSAAAGRRTRQVILHLANDFDGECEVGGLMVSARARGQGVGHLIARARYLFIEAHRQWFGSTVIAELRGYQDKARRSPVWDAVGSRFYDMEFAEADRLGAREGNRFIADLHPRHPIYVSMLPAEAQHALGRCHSDGEGALELLLREGFRAGDYVDIFDGGPTLTARIDELRSVRRAVRSTASATRSLDGGRTCLVCAGEADGFRAIMAELDDQDRLDTESRALLGLCDGDPYTFVPC